MSELQEITEWVLRNRKDKCFRGWERKDILRSLAASKMLGGLFPIRSAAGSLAGVAVGFPDHSRHTFHCAQWLCTEPVVKEFMRLFREHFDGYTITAHRWDKRLQTRKPVVYNTPRLCQLLEAIC